MYGRRQIKAKAEKDRLYLKRFTGTIAQQEQLHTQSSTQIPSTRPRYDINFTPGTLCAKHTPASAISSDLGGLGGGARGHGLWK
mmetsp:Transcript_15663/g.21980  ORF Transcript_15663/g.21980 Transcript_15663/m.21980 type:complete len:84 (-) Transcript_15663:97-348(-)